MAGYRQRQGLTTPTQFSPLRRNLSDLNRPPTRLRARRLDDMYTFSSAIILASCALFPCYPMMLSLLGSSGRLVHDPPLAGARECAEHAWLRVC